MSAQVNIDILSSIQALKKDKNAIILAHFYQTPDIQDLADFVGDSLELSRKAKASDADLVVFAGVVFMAETAKILNPRAKVVVPDMEAGCSLADECPAEEFKAFILKHPGHCVITYINSSAEVKALSDIICTSSNAVKVIESVPKDQPILFAPDKHLGRYLIRKTGREMVLWQGACVVHETFDAKKIVQLKARHSEAEVIAHPECPEAVLDLADFVGSTSKLLSYAKESSSREFIVVTEAGILHQMKKQNPDKIFHAAPNNETCNCAECPFMRLNTIEKIYHCLRDEKPEVDIAPHLREAAMKPLERMLSIA